MSWTKYRQGPHAVAKEAPTLHGMLVRSVAPPRVSQEEMATLLPQQVEGATARVQPNIHVSWEDGRERAQGDWGWRKKASNGGGTTGKIGEPVAGKGAVPLASPRIECSLQKPLNQKEAAKQEALEDVVDHQTGDKVFYRLPSGICVVAIVVETFAEGQGGNGMVLRTRPGAPLIRYVRHQDVSAWTDNVNERPKCMCGKHAAHNGVCFQRSSVEAS